MAETAVTLNDLEGHSPVAGLFKCNPSNICAAYYTISTNGSSALAELLAINVDTSLCWTEFKVQSTKTRK